MFKYVRKGAVLLARTFAPTFFVDLTLDETLAICRNSAKQNIATAICFWDDERDTPQSIADGCLAALAALPAARTDTYLSLKAPPLGYSVELGCAIAAQAKRHAIPLHFDSHAPETADPTFTLIDKIAKVTTGVGCTLPGRWRRSLDDADRVVEQGLSVRVVKGQWTEAGPSPVDPIRGFLAVVDRLAGRAPLVRVATHDQTLADEALRRLKAAGTPCELEMLFGFSNKKSADVAAALGVPVRYYIPFGRGWLPFVMDQIRENPGLVLQTALPGLRRPAMPMRRRAIN